MANTASAKKAVRVQARKTAVNKARRTMVRSQLRKVEDAIAADNAKFGQPEINLAAKRKFRTYKIKDRAFEPGFFMP